MGLICPFDSLLQFDISYIQEEMNVESEERVEVNQKVKYHLQGIMNLHSKCHGNLCSRSYRTDHLRDRWTDKPPHTYSIRLAGSKLNIYNMKILPL